MKKILHTILCVVLVFLMMATCGCVQRSPVRNKHRKSSNSSEFDKKSIPYGTVECEYCNGTEQCAVCDGNGYYYIDDFDYDYDYDYDDYYYDDYDYDDYDYYCDRCDGDGIMECPYCYDGYCRNCGGLGYYITTTMASDCTQCTNGNCSYCGGTEEMECTYCR